MVNLTFKEIGFRLIKAGRLEISPLCVYGSESIPENATLSCKIDRCIAKTIFMLASTQKNNSIYLGQDKLEDCCPGDKHGSGTNLSCHS